MMDSKNLRQLFNIPGLEDRLVTEYFASTPDEQLKFICGEIAYCTHKQDQLEALAENHVCVEVVHKAGLLAKGYRELIKTWRGVERTLKELLA